MTRRIRPIWGAPFAVLSVAAFLLGALYHRQALEAEASDAARKGLGSCCNPAPTEPGKATEPARKERHAKAALAAGLVLLGAAVAPAALASGEPDGPDGSSPSARPGSL